MAEEKNDKKPLYTVNVGSVSGCSWSNQFKKNGETRTFKTYSFQRNYQDQKTKEWKNFTSFTFATLGNLLIAIILIAVRECLGQKDFDETTLDDNIPV
jgi:hypothetical protein